MRIAPRVHGLISLCQMHLFQSISHIRTPQLIVICRQKYWNSMTIVITTLRNLILPEPSSKLKMLKNSWRKPWSLLNSYMVMCCKIISFLWYVYDGSFSWVVWYKCESWEFCSTILLNSHDFDEPGTKIRMGCKHYAHPVILWMSCSWIFSWSVIRQRTWNLFFYWVKSMITETLRSRVNVARIGDAGLLAESLF